MAEPLCMSCVHPECEYAGKDVRLFICLHEYTRKPMTNADRLRAGDNKYIAGVVCTGCPPGKETDAKFTGDGACYDCWLSWLQSPADGGDGDAN